MHLKRSFQVIVPLIISSMLMLAACTESESTPVSASTESKVCPESAQQFWKKFRAAVLKDDMNALADMTQFPLEVGGDMDNNPKKFVYRKNFNKHFSYLLSLDMHGNEYDPNPKPIPATMKDFAKAVTDVSLLCRPSNRQLNVGTWTFLSKPDGWRLMFVNSNEFMRAETEEPLHTTSPKE